MDKKVFIVAGIIILAIIAGMTYVALNKDASAPANNSTTDANRTAPPQEDTAPPVGDTVPAGRYIDYSSEEVAKTSGDKVLFFHAPWCPQCRELEKSIKSGTLPDNLTIFKVDYDTNQSLRQKYGVTLQTTLVKIDDAGNKIESYVAYGEPTFEAVKRELLQ